MLVQMMKAMHRHGCTDSTLTQQVELLLSDAALQDYTAAFTPGGKTQDYSSEFATGFISKFQYFTNRFTSDEMCSATSPLVNQQQDQNRFTPESGVKCREVQGEKHVSLLPTESTTGNEGCTSEIRLAPTETLKKNANFPVLALLEQEHASVQATPSPVVPAQVRKYKHIYIHVKSFFQIN